jgi:hypothetical protein
MQARLVLLAAFLFSPPSWASDLLVYTPDDDANDMATSLTISVRPGQKVSVSAGIFDKDGAGWDQQNRKAEEFTWTANCDANSPACPKFSMTDGSVVVTIDIPLCFAKGAVVYTVTHENENDLAYTPAHVTLNSTEEPSVCPDRGDSIPEQAYDAQDGAWGPYRGRGGAGGGDGNGSSGGSRAGGTYGGGGGSYGDEGGWGSGGRGGWGHSHRSWGDESGGGYSYSAQPGYNRGNGASAEVVSCEYGGAEGKLECRKVPEARRQAAPSAYYAQRPLRTKRAQPMLPKRPAPAHKTTARPRATRKISRH